MNIGIIGLGLMGKAMGSRLLAEGHIVTGFDISDEANRGARELGIHIAQSAYHVANEHSLLIFSLMTSDDRRNLLWGEEGIADTLGEGTTILDTTTGTPEEIQVDHDRLAQQNVQLVDVCISGSSQVVADGAAIALIGDTKEHGESYSGLLSTFCKEQYFFDSPGKGNEVKLIVNTVFGLNRLVLAEALALARAGGFNLETILEVLKQGETHSDIMDTKGQKMLSETYSPVVARLEQHAKDVGIILQYAKGLGAQTPVSELHQTLLECALENGGEGLDNAAIFKAYDPSKSGSRNY